MQNDNNRITAILTALLVLIMVVVFFVGVGFLVRGLFNGGDRNLVAGAGQTFLGGTAGLNGGIMSGFTNPQACSEGQYTRWTGVAWTCSTDRVGGERGPQGPQGPQGPAGPPGISYGSGGGTIGGTPQTCYSGQYSRWTGSYWTCETDRTSGSSYNYNDDYDSDVVRPQSCSSGQYSRWTGSYWTCETDRNNGSGGNGGSSYYAGAGLELNGDTFSLRGLQACSAGQYSRWTGSSWTCATDNGGGSGGNGSQGPAGPQGPQGPAGNGATLGPTQFTSYTGNININAVTNVECPQGSVMTGWSYDNRGTSQGGHGKVAVICRSLN